MLANCESSLALLVQVSKRYEEMTTTFGEIARAKSFITRLARETVSLAREVCGGNGILIQNQVIKAFMDMEALYTYEGSYDINTLVSGRELTGGLSAIK